jgi:hypothetical protein
VFRVRDVAASIGYYCDRRGWTKRWQHEEGKPIIAEVERGDLVIILDSESVVPKPEGPSVITVSLHPGALGEAFRGAITMGARRRHLVHQLQAGRLMTNHERRSSPILILAAATCAGVGACGSSSGDVTPADAGVPSPSVASCSEGWRPIIPPQESASNPRGPLRWQQNRLYFVDGRSSQITSLAETGGSPSPLSEDSVWAFWIEGDHALYTSVGKGNGVLLSVPLTGGAPSVLVDAHDGSPTSVHSFTQAVDGSFFYWDIARVETTDVYRIPRAGGMAQQLATLPTPLLERLTLTAAGLLASTIAGDAYLVRTDGGEARPLPRDGKPLGASADGVLWSRSRRGVGVDVLRTRLDAAAPEDFWPTHPPALVPTRAWPDGNGGWVVAALETFSDGAEHESVWLVDANQQGTRAACDPVGGPGTGYLGTDPAIAPDAFYLPAVDLRAEPRPTWTIIRVPRSSP